MTVRYCTPSTVNSASGSILFEQGQIGLVTIDTTMDNQPRFVNTDAGTIVLSRVYATLGKSGNSTTSIEASIVPDVGDGTAPSSSVLSILNVPSGKVYARWAALEGVTVSAAEHVQTRVSLAGNDAQDLTIYYFGTLI